jgi:hypothetical protein
MNRHIWLTIITILCSVSTVQADKKAEWQSDIGFLRKELPKRHKNLFSRIDRSTFEGELNALSQDLSDKESLDIALSLQQIVAHLGDDHTGIDYFPLLREAGRFPLDLYWFSDGLYVLGTTEPYKEILGNRIIAINNVPIDDVVSKLSGLLAKPNDSLIKHRIPNILPYAGALQHFDVTNNPSARITFVDTTGNERNIDMEKLTRETFGDSAKPVRYTPQSQPLCRRNTRALFWFTFLENDGILYAQYNRCWSKELEEKYGSKERAGKISSFEKFASDLLTNLEKPQVRRFVFDMRFNPGGSSPQGSALARKIGKIDQINRKGKIFVITGKRTYSSAVINAIDFKKRTHAILIGQPTSGKPNHFGEVKRFRLPSSGLMVSYSTKHFKYVDGDPPSLVPDIVVETSFSAFAFGEDPVLDAIRQYKQP